MSAYIKDSIPNYGLIGALLLTITLDIVINPPQFGFDDGVRKCKRIAIAIAM